MAARGGRGATVHGGLAGAVWQRRRINVSPHLPGTGSRFPKQRLGKSDAGFARFLASMVA